MYVLSVGNAVLRCCVIANMRNILVCEHTMGVSRACGGHAHAHVHSPGAHPVHLNEAALEFVLQRKNTV